MMRKNRFLDELENNAYKIDANYSEAMNEIINFINPNIYLNEYSKKSKRTKVNPLYKFKVMALNRESTLENYIALAKSLPKSNGSRLFNRNNIKIGIFSDKEFYDIWNQVATCEYIKPGIRVSSDFDLILIAPRPKANNDNSLDLDNEDETTNYYHKLSEWIKDFKSANVPTAYYNFNEEQNFDNYINVMKHCDFIFTQNADRIPKLIKASDNTNVTLLKEGINPFTHNPIGTCDNSLNHFQNMVLYVGGWDNENRTKSAEGKRLINEMISERTPFFLVDNNFHKNNPNLYFPIEYIPFVTMPIENSLLNLLFKVFPWHINLNDEKYTEFHYSDNMLKAMATGNIVISNYSTSINNMFTNVRMVHADKDFTMNFQTATKDIKELKAKSIRNVFNEHTIHHRAQQLLDTMGIKSDMKMQKILVVLEDDSAEAKESFERQIYPYKEKVLLEDLIDCDLNEYNFVTFFSRDYVYEEYYLEDMLTAFKYVDVDFVKKDNNETGYDYSSQITDIYLTMIDTKSFSSLENINDLSKGFNTDFIEVLKVDDLPKTNSNLKELSVIVPIHNNGIYLEEKCFASLKRSSVFEKMEIIFINDGSTDELTKKIINRILRRHPDIVYIENEKGSGSASKPRNQGVKVATTDYITYLDPDNEALGDGYKFLLESIKQHDVDMVVGNIIREDNNRKGRIRYTDVVKENNDKNLLINNPREFLIESKLRVQSIQALLVKRDIILENNLEMVEGAAGQDTMFYQELILNSSSVLALEEYIHVYYAAVTGSVTNTVSANFFKKFYKLELKRVPHLLRHGLMETYIEQRLNNYIKSWYLKKLDNVPEEQYYEAATTLLKIIELYRAYNPILEQGNSDRINQLQDEINRSHP